MTEKTYTWTVTVDAEELGMTIFFGDGKFYSLSFDDGDGFYSGIPEAIESWVKRLGVEV